jgi:hypothetical protein
MPRKNKEIKKNEEIEEIKKNEEIEENEEDGFIEVNNKKKKKLEENSRKIKQHNEVSEETPQKEVSNKEVFNKDETLNKDEILNKDNTINKDDTLKKVPKRGWNIPVPDTPTEINKNIKFNLIKQDDEEIPANKIKMIEGFFKLIKYTDYKQLIEQLIKLGEKINNISEDIDNDLIDIIFDAKEIPDFIIESIEICNRKAFIAICNKLYEVIEENNKKYILQVLKIFNTSVSSSSPGPSTPIPTVDIGVDSPDNLSSNIIAGPQELGEFKIFNNDIGESFYITKYGKKGNVCNFDGEIYFNIDDIWKTEDNKIWKEPLSSNTTLQQPPIKPVKQTEVNKYPNFVINLNLNDNGRNNHLNVTIFDSLGYTQKGIDKIIINSIEYKLYKSPYLKELISKLNDIYCSSERNILRGKRHNQPPFVQTLSGLGEFDNKIVGLLDYNPKFEKFEERVCKKFEELNKLEKLTITKKKFDIKIGKGEHYLIMNDIKYATYYLPRDYVEKAREENQGFHFLIETNNVYYIGISFCKIDLNLQQTPSKFR